MPASANDRDVRRHLAGLVFQDAPLDTFIDWFHSALWGIEQLASDHDLDLAYRIENRLAELSGGHITEDELMTGFRDDAVEFGVRPPAAASSPQPRVRLIPIRFSAPLPGFMRLT